MKLQSISVLSLLAALTMTSCRLDKPNPLPSGPTCTVQLSPVFFGWCCTFGDRLKIISPKEVVEGMKKHISAVSSLYEEEAK